MSDQVELDRIILELLGREQHIGKKGSVVIYNSEDDIVKLDLSSLGLTSLPDGFFDNFTELRELDLSHNSFNQLPSDLFRVLGNLKLLNLSAALNPMDFSVDENVSLPEDLFRYQKQLTQLNLSDNQLEALPDGIFAQLYNLEILDLSYNLLALLPPSIGNLVNLERLYLDSNFLPVEFLDQYLGYQEVQNFLAPFQTTWMSLNESTVVVPEEQSRDQTEEELKRAFSILEDLFD